MEVVSTREKSKVEKKSAKQLVTAPMPYAQAGLEECCRLVVLSGCWGR